MEKKIKYNLMSIGGYCLSIYVLGNDRLKGPVDNVMPRSADVINLLLENKYFDYIINTKPDEVIINKSDGTSKIFYEYENIVSLYHNIPYEEKFKIELKKRIDRFNNFYNNLKQQDNYYFIFTIPHCWINEYTQELLNNELERCIKYFKKFDILNKVIFIGAKQSNEIKNIKWYNVYLNDKNLKYFKEKYNINYIQLDNIIIDKENKIELDNIRNQFNEKLINLLN